MLRSRAAPRARAAPAAAHACSEIVQSAACAASWRAASRPIRHVAHARVRHMAIRRHLLGAAVCAALLALCAPCCAVASTTPASPLAQRASGRASAPATAPARGHSPRRASFHTRAGSRRQSRTQHRLSPSPGHRHKPAPRPPHSPAPRRGAVHGHALQPHPGQSHRVRAATLCLVNRERTGHGERPLRLDPPLQRRPRAHRRHGLGDYFEHNGPRGDTPLIRMRAAGYIAARASATKSARTSPGARCGWPRRARSSPPGWNRPDTAPTSSTRLPRHRDRRLAAPARVAGPRPGRRDLHAGLRRHHQLSASVSRAPVDRRSDNLRANSTTRRNSYGSTGRQVGDRHRLGARNRTRDRGAARLAGRAGPDQRPRRRHRRAGLRRRSPARRPCSPAT